MGNKGGKIVLTDDIVSQISLSSGIDPAGVRTQCENFLKEYPKGCMDKKAFRKFIKIALPKINAEKMEEHLFRMYDTNMDGLISMEEFLIFYHICSEGSPEQNLQKARPPSLKNILPQQNFVHPLRRPRVLILTFDEHSFRYSVYLMLITTV